MESKERQILSEIKQMMVSLRKQMDELEMKMAQLDVLTDVSDDELIMMDLELPDAAVSKAEAETLPEPVRETPLVESTEESQTPGAIIDVMSSSEAWRNDMPGTPVRDVRCAIALVDRASFINTLFSEDPVLFNQTLNDVNSMQTLDEVVGYLKENFPVWDFESDSVYRFMMAVRRKVN